MLNVRQSFHDELAALEQELLHMGTLTGTMLQHAVEAIQQNDTSLAESVLQEDDAVDELDRKIEAQCIRLLALQQPMARDLRQIESALKVITDLERIGDHAVDIAKIARKMTQEFYLKAPLLNIAPLAERAQTMLHQSLESLVRHDLELAVQVCNDDDQADDAFKALREDLLTMTQREPTMVFPASYMLLAVVYMERIADHATNIAERVYYTETGTLEDTGASRRTLRRAMSDIADNLARVQERIAAAAERSGRRIEEITLVAVTKKQSALALLEAKAAGIRNVGENYVQETAEKQALQGPARIQDLRWHLIGHLQSNKAKAAVSLFGLIQSVDSVKVARALGKAATDIGKRQDILLQVHLGDEATKTGLPPEQMHDAALEIAEFPGVRLCGLMGIAPLGVDPAPSFQKMRRLFESLPDVNRHVLSMGMSGDFEAAIEEGATMVRIGMAIFGTRN